MKCIALGSSYSYTQKVNIQQRRKTIPSTMRLRVEPRKYCMTMASYGQCRQAAAKAMVYPAIGTLCVHWAFIGVEHLGVFHETQHQSALAKQLPKDGRLEERSVVMAKLICLVEDLLASSYAK